MIGKIKNHWMKNFFISSVFVEIIRQNQDYERHALSLLLSLHLFFNKSCFIYNLIALVLYNTNGYDQSVEVFQLIQQQDPYRYESMDILSNIYYVQERKNDLGRLALRCYELDKYIPETQCILGNYYSLVGEHVKSAKHFARCTQIDPEFLAAYTLLGHEFLELKNVERAIDAYNKAVKINPRDYRAWYGLGQAYEMDSHLQYSLEYFKQALYSNFKDSRMWSTIGNLYQKMESHVEAMKCLEKAEALKSFDGVSLYYLGQVYELVGNSQKTL